jgi:hypothetical protein
MKKNFIAPNILCKDGWEGSIAKKPWEYKVTAVIPCINEHITLPFVIDILRLQTERPYIVIIDTGTINQQNIEDLRDEDVEIHFIRSHSWKHPSEPVTAAMDLALSFVHTPFMFCTHSDCFLKRRDLLEEMVDLCRLHKAVGYQLSPRSHPDWEWMLGHTCTMFDVKILDKINATWGLRRLCNNRGVELKPNVCGPNWPDTELLINYILKDNGISPYLMGSENNAERTNDNNIDHCRSIPSAILYDPKYLVKNINWIDDAVEQAKKRIKEWSKSRDE